jgi:hypothetical protein
MSFNSSNTPAGQEIRATRRQHLTAALITASAFNERVRNFVLARALDGLDLRQLEHLVDEVDETFYGDKPDFRPLLDQKRPNQ